MVHGDDMRESIYRLPSVDHVDEAEIDCDSILIDAVSIAPVKMVNIMSDPSDSYPGRRDPRTMTQLHSQRSVLS